MPREIIFRNCNVCGRGLVEDVEFDMGMCLVCANEEIPDPMSKPRRSTTSPKPRGFAVMSPERRREIARMGGAAVANVPGHMAEIGARGGATTGKRLREMMKRKVKGGFKI